MESLITTLAIVYVLIGVLTSLFVFARTGSNKAFTFFIAVMAIPLWPLFWMVGFKTRNEQ